MAYISRATQLPKPSLKNTVFRISGRLLRRAWPLSALARRYFRGRAAVVFYHGVWPVDDEARRSRFGGMRVNDFTAEMRRLAAFFEIVPLSQILSPSPPPRQPGKPIAAVTFDDGLDLRAAGVVDVLDSLRIRATTFVNTASLAGGHLMWMHRFSVIRAERGEAVLLRELNRVLQTHAQGPALDNLNGLIPATRAWPQERKDEWAAQMWESAGLLPVQQFLDRHRPYADLEQLRDWLGRGHEVGVHTHSHPFCSRLSDELLESELIAPASQLRQSLGIDCPALAYPFGDRCRPDHEARLRQLGIFSGLIGTAGFSPMPTDPHALERVEAEPGIDQEVFGKPILRTLRRRS